MKGTAALPDGARAFGIHQLPNGWTVEEYEHPTQRQFVEIGQCGAPVEFKVLLIHIPSERVVRCVHLIGTSDHDRKISVRVALRNARPGRATHHGQWEKIRRRGKTTYAYTITLGSRVNVDSAFAQIAAQLENEIFSSITTGMEVPA